MFLIQVNDKELHDLYKNHKSAYPDDAGIDLYFPDDIIVPKNTLGFMIPLKIRVELLGKNNANKSYFLVARSSIYSTPLRLSSHIGIIDAGFRGEMCLIVDNLSNYDYNISKHTKLCQICSPKLKPIRMCVVNKLSNGSRGNKGLGSSNVMSKL